MNDRHIIVIGAGTMGAGIAEVFGKAGFRTHLHDVSSEVISRGMTRIHDSLNKALAKGKLDNAAKETAQKNITALVDISALNIAPELIIEAVPEDIELKKRVLKPLAEKFVTSILASNTSSLSVTEIAASLPKPQRFLGMHFFNPPAVMPLLEVVLAEQTDENTQTQVRQIAQAIGKTAIFVHDAPGFATSRLGIVLGMEAIRMFESGVAGVADIDKAMELGYRHPMGPLMLTDLVGLDVRLAIAEHLSRELGPQFSPPPLLRRLVRAGKLGKKSGEGFYLWQGDTATPRSR